MPTAMGMAVKHLLLLAATMLLSFLHHFTHAAIITNSHVILGITDKGNLNTPYARVVDQAGHEVLPAADPAKVGFVGLRAAEGGGLYTSTEKGCLCEGWGVAVRPTGGNIEETAMYANEYFGSSDGLTVVSTVGTNGGSEFTSVTQHRNLFRVTHYYHTTDKTKYAMECDVTIENIHTNALNNVRYRRTMDWDIDPTPFSDHITIHLGKTAPANYLRSNTNGFCSSNPLTECEVLYYPDAVNQSFADFGPMDIGANFDFKFGNLAPGSKVTFKTFYGAAPGELAALDVIAAVDAELYSFGQQRDDPYGGFPYTFLFAFSGVGGSPVMTNDAPTLTSVVTDTAVVKSGTPVKLRVIFVDDNAQDTHSIKVYWDKTGDQSIITSQTLPRRDRSVEVPHSYSSTGFYQICLELSDGKATASYCLPTQVVVYDPLGPGLTGNGAFEAPAGTYPEKRTAKGFVQFAITARYADAAAVKPTGEVKMTFRAAAGLEIRAKNFDWLVVKNGVAWLQGRGWFVGGKDLFDFKLRVVDGNPDTFWLQMVTDSGQVVFDNLQGGFESVLRLIQGDIAFTLP